MEVGNSRYFVHYTVRRNVCQESKADKLRKRILQSGEMRSVFRSRIRGTSKGPGTGLKTKGRLSEQLAFAQTIPSAPLTTFSRTSKKFHRIPPKSHGPHLPALQKGYPKRLLRSLRTSRRKLSEAKQAEKPRKGAA